MEEWEIRGLEIGIGFLSIGSFPDFVASCKIEIIQDRHFETLKRSSSRGNRMFPFSIEKRMEVPIYHSTAERVSEAVLRTLAGCIQAEKPGDLTLDQHTITFAGGPFLSIGGWNLFTSIDYGEIKVLPDRDRVLVSYKILYTRLFIMASLVTVLFAAFISDADLTIPKFTLVAGAWLWFFGANLIITQMRFQSLVDLAVKQAANQLT